MSTALGSNKRGGKTGDSSALTRMRKLGAIANNYEQPSKQGKFPEKIMSMGLANSSLNTARIYNNDAAVSQTTWYFTYSDAPTNKHISGIGGTDLPANLVIPEGVESIEYAAFYSGYTGLVSVSFPSTLLLIDDFAFYQAVMLQSIVLPSNLVTIGYASFSDCTQLTGSLTIPASVVDIDGFAFAYCSGLTGLTILSSGSIGSAAFYGCPNIGGVLTIPSTITDIIDNAFAGCSSLTGLTILSSGSIGPSAFYACTGLLGSLTIPSTITDIGYTAFQLCAGLNGTLTISSTGPIGDSAFVGTIFSSLVINTGPTSIGDSTFEGITTLSTTTHIPLSVLAIGNRAFANCTNASLFLEYPVAITPGTDAFLNCVNVTTY
jgi:hypothetical protein